MQASDRSPRPLRALADRLPARRRRADGALQPALRAPREGHVHPAHRGHRRRALARGADRPDPLGDGVAGPRIRRGPLPPVAALGPLPRGGRAADSRGQGLPRLRDAGGARRRAQEGGGRRACRTATRGPGARSRPRRASAARGPASGTSCACAMPDGDDRRRGPRSAAASSFPPTPSTTSSSCAPTAIRSTTSASASTTSDMRITHVIRGDDHLANTPKHVALFRALGAPIPQFAHLGMILGTDRKKLSKRHGAAAVEEWRDAGILPEALFNFLALLGWAPGRRPRDPVARGDGAGVLARPRRRVALGVRPREAPLDERAVHRADAGRGAPRASLALCAGRRSGPRDVALRAIELHRTARPHDDRDGPRARPPTRRSRRVRAPTGSKKHVKPETAAQLEALAARLEALARMDRGVDRGGAAREPPRRRRRLGRQADPSDAPRPDRRDRGRAALRRRRAAREGDGAAAAAAIPRRGSGHPSPA